MFITDPLKPVEVIAELLRLRGYSKRDTAEFRHLKHDAQLCPSFRDNLSVVLNAYKGYGTWVHDIQGLHDEGIDVLLKYTDDDGGKRRIGFQIKSFDDIEKYRTKQDKTFTKTLKSAWATANQQVGVDHYYVLLCTDETKHSIQIRNICSQLKNFNNTSVILPREALAFYSLADFELSARVTGLLCADDPVLREAQQIVNEKEPALGFMTLAVTCKALSDVGQSRNGNNALSLTSEDLSIIYGEWEEAHPKEAIKEKNKLENLLFSLDPWQGLSETIDLGGLHEPLCALYFDARVRLGVRTDRILGYLAALLSVD